MSDTLQPPWTVAHQAPLSMGFLRQEYWSGLPFPSSGDLSHRGTELPFPAVAGRFFTRQNLLQANSFLEPPRKPIYMYIFMYHSFTVVSDMNTIFLFIYMYTIYILICICVYVIHTNRCIILLRTVNET